MLAFHRDTNADCTIAALTVSLEEASRFGIMNTKPDGEIYEFEEKPKQPKSDKASMGIYIFKWDKLKAYLEADEKTPGSSNDFGKDILPTMLAAGERMMAYPFEGYWKDVGTVESLWEANLDLLRPSVELDLSDPAWKIFYKSPLAAPQYIGEDARVTNSLISDGCSISGAVDFSVLFTDVTVEKGAVVRDSIIMPGAKIKSGAVVQYAILAENVTVGENAVVGGRPEESADLKSWGVAVVASGVVIGSNCAVAAKEMVAVNK
jgi:glucose-1-phosphate adenylyltransferase